VATLGRTIPALPVRDAASSAAFYRDRLGFRVLHDEEGFVILERDGAQVHLWQAGDETWRGRAGDERPVRSGAESFIAGTASCRIEVVGVDALYEELRPREVVHSVSRDGVSETEYGSREFAMLDADGNLISFFEWVEK